ncbi:MAG TPA: type II toxin-antitoxin system PrlF family antitoxin, partial [Xanthobacteraceae bacterium]|nr:type II toxin-antitoxin system PrlF family antitoxin [Xanthobacteraceae bacterium]
MRSIRSSAIGSRAVRGGSMAQPPRLHLARFLTILQIVRNQEPAMSTDSTLTSKGQTTIPKAIRDCLHMKTGDRMTFTLMPDGVVLMRVK